MQYKIRSEQFDHILLPSKQQSLEYPISYTQKPLILERKIVLLFYAIGVTFCVKNIITHIITIQINCCKK